MGEEWNATIVAIDDQAVVLNTVASILKEDYQVKPFTSGVTALKYMEKHVPDLVLMDHEMPGMTGCDVLERLQSYEGTKGIPVIFLTGSIYSETEVEVLEKGATDYIAKPIKAKVLLTRIRLHLELTRYRKRLEALVAEKTEDLRKANEKLKIREDITFNLLARATDMRDHDTGGHIKRTTEIVRILATYLMNNPEEGYALTREQVDDVIKSSKLHDLGKIAIPDKILLKEDKLEENEFDIIKQHPIYGADILDEYATMVKDDSLLSTARDITLYHHERWNGQGYPMGLKGTEIPLAARIVCLADVYDALISARSYKEGFLHEKALEIIKEESGTLLDPKLVSVFLACEKEFQNLALTFQSNEMDQAVTLSF